MFHRGWAICAGSLFVPGQGNALSQSLPPPSGVSPYPVQHSLQSQAGIPDSIPSMAPYPQKDAVSMSRKSDAESIQNVSANSLQVCHGK